MWVEPVYSGAGVCKAGNGFCGMSFMIAILDNLIIIILNTSLWKYGGDSLGDILITCATVIQSFMTIVACPAQGITTGCQTIFSFHYGAGNYTKIWQAFLCLD